MFFYYSALAFFSGAAVMLLEIGAGKLLTPLFGASVEIWTIVIAFTLFSLSLGYYLGGRLADRFGGRPIAILGIALAAMGTFAVPWLKDLSLPLFVSLPLLSGATLTAVTLFTLPLVAFAFVSPALIKALAQREEPELGRKTGLIYAISTFGSLAGTLLSGLYLFLHFPIDQVLIACAFFLLLLILAERPKIVGALLMAMLVWTGLASQSFAVADRSAADCRLLDSRNSFYGDVRVIECGHARSLLINGIGQGAIDQRDGQSLEPYDLAISGVLAAVGREPRRALIIGLGVGAIHRTLVQQGAQVESVDIDPAVIDLARRHFNFSGRATAIDGRRFTEQAGETFDTIVLNAFVGDDPPWHIYTAEAFADFRNRLSDGGTLVVNVFGNHLDPDQRPVLEAMQASLNQAFASVMTFPDPFSAPTAPARNYLMLASDQTLAMTESLDSTNRFALAWQQLGPLPLHDGVAFHDEHSALPALNGKTARQMREFSRARFPLALLVQ